MQRPKWTLLAGAALATASACANVPPPPVDLAGEVIIYETSPGPWCGRCDTLKITAAEDGRVWVERGWWAGRYEDWREKHEVIMVTPAQLAAFRARLDPHRPEGKLWLRGDGEECTVFYSDSEERTVSWRGPKGEDELWYNFGCDPQTKAALRNDLEAAPDALGIAGVRYIGVATTRIR